MAPAQGDLTMAETEEAIEIDKATDADSIRERVPEDIRERLTKQAFSPGSMKKILRDTYYLGPIGIGTGGWHGMFGGQPGTEMRRPHGALYNFPRSWRYSALERALKTGLITHVGGGRFSATERGVAVLRQIDRCETCGKQREPMIRTSVYVGNPNTEGSIESHQLVTACSDHESTGYAGESVTSGLSSFDRDEEYVENAVKAISDVPEARTYGGDRDVDPDAASHVPDVDESAVDEVLDTYVEDYTPAKPRDLFDATEECLYGRPVIPIDQDGRLYRFRGTAESVVVSRTDTEGDFHLTLDGDDRVKVGMSYELAVDYGYKDMLHYDAEDAEWTGDYWTVGVDRLGRVVSKLTLGTWLDERGRDHVYFPDSDDESTGEEEYFDVTIDPEAIDAMEVPMVGIESDGSLIDGGNDD